MFLYQEQVENIKHGPIDLVWLTTALHDMGMVTEGVSVLIRQRKGGIQGATKLGFEIKAVIRKWIDGYEQNYDVPEQGLEAFWVTWKVLRCWVPLQLRLAVEQVLYEKGGDWRRLVTGFRPIENR